MNTSQSHFVKLIIDYVVKNGFIEKRVLMEEPFRTVGSVVEIFNDKKETITKILNVIDEINDISVEGVGV